MKYMEQAMNQTLRILTKLTKVQSVKMATHLLLSLSLFSFIFSRPYLPSLLHSLNFCLSTFPYRLFTRTLDKNVMFLLCNGLLVFLAKYSGLVGFLSLYSGRQDELDGSDPSQVLPQNKGIMILEKEVSVDSSYAIITGSAQSVAVEEENEKELFTNKGETKMEKVIIEDDEEDEQGSEFVDSKDSNEAKEDNEEENALVHVEEEEEEQEEEEEEEQEQEDEGGGGGGNGKLTTEELNKKFDDFIRRMKEELRIEAQRHLVIV